MQYDENAEKYGYEGEMTPMKCAELKAYKGDVTIPVYGTIADAQVYLKEKADAAIAELKGQVNGFKNRAKLWEYNALNEHNAAVEVRIENEKLKAKLAEKDKEIAELKKKLMPCLNGDCILTCEVVEKYGKENAELKKGNERLKKKMDDYHLMSDIRRAKIKELKRALWLARAERASDKARIFYFNYLETMLDIDGFSYDSKKKKGHKKLTARIWRIIWLKVERKCIEKAEEYK